MKKIMTLALACAAIAMPSCKSKAPADAAGEKKSIVLYYSQTGATQAVAEALGQKLGLELEAIELVDPYPADYDSTIARCQQERAAGIFPAIKPLQADLATFDTIYLGYPVWFGTYALPVGTLLQANSFAGKVIIPFCTFGSGGLENTEANLRQALPQATILPGYGVRNARIAKMPQEIDRFLIEGGYMAGEVTPLPAYSAPQPVTDTERAIFDAACSGYRFPLGTPVSVGSRQGDNGTDYLYLVNSKIPDGEEAVATIYVTVSPDSVAEFTKVVR